MPGGGFESSIYHWWWEDEINIPFHPQSLSVFRWGADFFIWDSTNMDRFGFR